MKQNKKGFTLIELLAVIVILAIIALIATPIVLNMINSAKKSAAKSSALGFVDSIEYYAGFHQASTSDLTLAGYETPLPTIPTNATTVTCTLTEATDSAPAAWDATCSAFMAAVEAKSKGKGPKAASIILDSAGKVQNNSTLTYDGGVCTYENNDCTMDKK